MKRKRNLTVGEYLRRETKVINTELYIAAGGFTLGIMNTLAEGAGLVTTGGVVLGGMTWVDAARRRKKCINMENILDSHDASTQADLDKVPIEDLALNSVSPTPNMAPSVE